MFNSNLFKSKIYEKGFDMQDVSKSLNMKKSTFSIKSRGKTEFKYKEMYMLKKILNLTDTEFIDIFIGR